MQLTALGIQRQPSPVHRTDPDKDSRSPRSCPGTCGGLYLEDGSVHFLVVVLLAGVLPRDSEHALLVALPDQARVQVAVDLLNQPLPQAPAAVPVTHAWGGSKDIP